MSAPNLANVGLEVVARFWPGSLEGLRLSTWHDGGHFVFVKVKRYAGEHRVVEYVVPLKAEVLWRYDRHRDAQTVGSLLERIVGDAAERFEACS